MSSTAIKKELITGLVLAGGLGRRMSADGAGVDKGLQPFRARPMVAHVIERLAPQVGELLINANQNQAIYSQFSYPVFGDAIGGFAGPLAGLHAGLAHATTPYLATVPCDSPFFPDNLIEQLADALLKQDAKLAVASSQGRAHPVFMLLCVSVRESLQDFLQTGQRKIDAWYAQLPVATVDFDDEAAFRNINTPQELQQFE